MKIDGSVRTRRALLDALEELFARAARRSYLGERVSMSAHMLQAAYLADASGAPETIVAAALLHDLGHYGGGFAESALASGIDNRHASVGARMLSPFLPPAVTEPIRLHVEVKRYLCATEPGFVRTLTPASVQTLTVQGGPMTEAEAAHFEATCHLEEAISVRRFDDAGKAPGREVPGFAYYRPLLDGLMLD